MNHPSPTSVEVLRIACEAFADPKTVRAYFRARRGDAGRKPQPATVARIERAARAVGLAHLLNSAPGVEARA
jgi:hypothetical protein